jgi:hypothetical protein
MNFTKMTLSTLNLSDIKPRSFASLTLFLKIIAGLKSVKHALIVVRVFGQPWPVGGGWGGCSERVLLLCQLLTPRYSISVDPPPYFILACNTPYYVVIHITEPVSDSKIFLYHNIIHEQKYAYELGMRSPSLSWIFYSRSQRKVKKNMPSSFAVSVCLLSCNIFINAERISWNFILGSEISGSHGGEYEDGCLLGC